MNAFDILSNTMLCVCRTLLMQHSLMLPSGSRRRSYKGLDLRTRASRVGHIFFSSAYFGLSHTGQS